MGARKDSRTSPPFRCAAPGDQKNEAREAGPEGYFQGSDSDALRPRARPNVECRITNVERRCRSSKPKTTRTNPGSFPRLTSKFDIRYFPPSKDILSDLLVLLLLQMRSRMAPKKHRERIPVRMSARRDSRTSSSCSAPSVSHLSFFSR